jgi:FMN-dependent NADH-azoreductase
MKLLHIDSSPLAANSASRELTRRTVAQWQSAHPNVEVEHLDLVADAPAHLAHDSLGFRLGIAAEGLTEAQQRENALSEKLVSQFLAADVVVLGAPMYNFSVPSQLKAWIDRIAQAGRTFRYTEKGPQGLAGGKTVVIVSTRGGAYGDASVMDHQESYLKAVLGFFGVTDIRIVRAEGLAMGDAGKAQGLEAAQRAIQALATDAANEDRTALRA